MAYASTTQLAYAIQTFYASGWREGVFRNDRLLGMLRAYGMVEQQAPGGTSHNWHINSGYNTSVATFTEGSAAPTAVAQSWVRPSLSWTYFWGWVAITGHAKDALQNGIFDAISAEMSLAQRDIVDLRTTTYLGSTSPGLQLAVAATGTYAGITRGSAAYFEGSASTTNSVAGLRALHRTIRDASKGGNPQVHIVSPTISDWYAARVGLPGTGNSVISGNNTGPQNFDVGYNWTGQTFMGRPIVEVPDLTSSVWIMLDTSAMNVKHIVIREFQVKFHHNEGDSEIYEISTGSTLAVEQSIWQGILTGMS